MSINSSSTHNDSVSHQNHSATNFYLSELLSCLISGPASMIAYTYFLVHVFLHLPISVFIIYHVLQQIKCSVFSAGGLSHSDCITFNMVIMELIGVLGYLLCFCGIYKEKSAAILLVGTYLSTFPWLGEMFFHMLTCLEHYLAVVHPITYLRLKNETGIRIRNIIIGCVWILCCVGIMLICVFTIVNFCLLFLAISTVSFCSISVLRVLIRSGPGDQVGSRERVDQSKRRAFYIIVVILVVLMVRFVWGLFWAIQDEVTGSTGCIIFAVDFWVNLPSSLILPVLFLFRSGKCVCCKKTIFIKRSNSTHAEKRHGNSMQKVP